MKKLYMAAVVAILLIGCTDATNSKRILEDAGYTDVKMHGYDIFNCAKDDAFHDKFTAKAPNGRSVSGAVCAGLLFKGSTIRLD